MTPFAGYEMPLYYRSILEEHRTVRKHAGLFDVSHMARFLIRGKDAYNYLQSLVPSSLHTLTIGRARYTVLLNHHGGILDDIILYRIDEETFLMVGNATNRKKDFQWLHCQKPQQYSVEIEDLTDELALFALQGPQAEQILATVTDDPPPASKTFRIVHSEVAGIPHVYIATTGYTGEPGYELFVPAGNAHTLWTRLIDAGKSFGLQPIGLGARDALRLEMGYCLWGQDIDESTTPVEANLAWLVAWKSPHHYPGRDILHQQRQQGIQRLRVAILSTQPRPLRHGMQLWTSPQKDQMVGTITSGGFSPCLQRGIAMAYVLLPWTQPGTTLYAGLPQTRSPLPVQVTSFPLYNRENGCA